MMSRNILSCDLCDTQVTSSSIRTVLPLVIEHYEREHGESIVTPTTPPFATEPVKEEVSGDEFVEEWKWNLFTQEDTLVSEAGGVYVDEFTTHSAPPATEDAESLILPDEGTPAGEYIESDSQPTDEEEKYHPEKPEETVVLQRKRGRPKMSEAEKKKKAESRKKKCRKKISCQQILLGK